MDDAAIRTRLKALRQKHALSQEEMARRMGFNDRQTLSDLELGNRKLAPADLVKAAEVFGTTVYALTDPFMLVGEGQFSWRQRGADAQQLDAFEATAGSWVGAFRYLNQLKGDPVNSALRRIDLGINSTFEDAQAEGEAIATTLALGDVPAQRLASALQEELDTLVLFVDTVKGVSGAACQLGALNAILVNRNESTARRNYDMAHELFHLLTWQTMPPQRLDQVEGAGPKYKRIENLADNFAAGLLMPTATVNKLITQTPLPAVAALPGWLAAASRLMQVSPTAMLWRLVNLRHVQRTAAERMMESNVLGSNSRESRTDALPLLFSARFLSTISWGLDKGHLSARRASSLLRLSLDELAMLFEQHDLVAPFDL